MNVTEFIDGWSNIPGENVLGIRANKNILGFDVIYVKIDVS